MPHNKYKNIFLHYTARDYTVAIASFDAANVRWRSNKGAVGTNDATS